uniref:Myb-like domain-containing protein n=1 Tax=Romanomermis culicivorax TaxID=13658 RepID=A0A915ILH8_ROMCU
MKRMKSSFYSIWYPPTPPPSDLEDSAADFDPYFEPTMGFLYERTPMTESELPPLYVESQIADRSPFKSPKRNENRSSSSAGDNGISTPQNLTSSSSLTQNPTPHKFADVKRLETRLRTPVSPAQAVRPASGEQSPQIGHPSTKSNPPLTTAAAKQPKPSRRPGTPPVGVTENESADVVYEWNLLEDYSLFNAVTKVQHAHQSSVIVGNNEGHGINWDLVSECVAASCGRYRSPKQCHRRYEMVILPREEGRAVLADHPPVISTKKSRKLDAEMAASKKFRIRTIYQFQNEGQSFMNSFVGQRFRNSTGLRIKRSLLNKRASYGICRSGAEPKHRGAGWSSLPTNFQANLIDPFKMVELYEERLRVEEKRKQLHQQQLAEQAAATISTRSLTAPGAITIVQQPQQMAGSSTAGLPSGATVIPFQLPIGQQQLQGQQLSFMVNSQGGRLLTRPVQQSTYQQVNQNSGPFASRQTNHPMPVNVQTTTVYRQMHPQTFKMQQTPPGTPNPVAAYQASVSSAAAMANYQTGAGGRTYIEIPASSSGVVVQSAVGGSAQQLTNQQTQVVSQPPLDFTSLIKQQPQQRVAVSGATKQKIQFGNGSFLVSADITKGSSTGSQIATVLPAGARFSGTPVRTQVQLSNAGANIHQHNIRRNSPLPRGVGMQRHTH